MRMLKVENAMQVTGELKNNAFVVTIQGQIDTETYGEFNKILEGYVEGNFTPFVINCKDLEYINSSGLTSFVHLSQMLETFQLKLLFCEIQPAVQEVIDITELGTYFNIYATEQAALESL